MTQAASLLKKTSHVGKIKSRCYEEDSCSVDEAATIKRWGFAPSKVHDHEKIKAYPVRYPMNEDSVGIETVAKFDQDAKMWEAPTPQQAAAISKLMGILKDEYGISDADIYEHDKVSYKQPGEGAGLYDGFDDSDRSVPPRFPPAIF